MCFSKMLLHRIFVNLPWGVGLPRLIRPTLETGTWDVSKASSGMLSQVACFNNLSTFLQAAFWKACFKNITGNTQAEIKSSCFSLAKEHLESNK